MAFKLTKKESSQRDDLVADLEIEGGKLTSAVEAYNEAVREAFSTLQEAAETYNEKLSEAREFVEYIASRMQSEFDEKSERWQEGDKASSVADMISEWENISLDYVEFEEPEVIECDLAHRDDLENLPSEAE